MSWTRMATLAALGAGIALSPSASIAMPGSPGSLSLTTGPAQFVRCMVDDGGGRMRSCDTLGGGAYKGTKTKGHAQTKKPKSTNQ